MNITAITTMRKPSHAETKSIFGLLEAISGILSGDLRIACTRNRDQDACDLGNALYGKRQ